MKKTKRTLRRALNRPSYKDMDVLVGRHRFCRENSGNKLLRQVARQRFGEHERADRSTDYMDEGLKKNRLDIKKEIVATIKAAGGRFLRRNESGGWVELSEKEAVARIVEEFKHIRAQQRQRGHRNQKQDIADEHEVEKLQVTSERSVLHFNNRSEAPSPTSNQALEPSEKSRLQFDNQPEGGLSEDQWAFVPETDSRSNSRRHEGSKSIRKQSQKFSCADVASSLDFHHLSDDEINVSENEKSFSEERSARKTDDMSWTVTASHVHAPLSIEGSLMSISAVSRCRQLRRLTIGTFSHSSTDEFVDSFSVQDRTPSVVETAATDAASPPCLDLPEAFEISTTSINVTEEIHTILEQMKDLHNETALADSMESLAWHATSIENESIIAVAGGLEECGIRVIVRALRTYPCNALLLQWGCFSFAGLAVNDDNKRLITKEGGVGVIVRAMEKFHGRQALQTWGCLAIANLAGDKDNVTVISREGGLEAVVSAMKNFPTVERLQGYGCFALARLTENNPHMAEVAGVHEGVEVVIGAMQQFSFSSVVSADACVALEVLGSASESNQKKILAQGGIELVRWAWRYVLSQDEKDKIETTVSTTHGRYIFVDSFF